MKYRNCIKKILSFLTIICCLAGSILPVSATGTGSAPAVPRVTFTNRPNESPDLFVAKTVENAVSGSAYEAPEHAAYRFVLKLGGEIAKNVPYRVLDAEGREIIRETSTGRKYPFQTDSAGIFTLEAGQQAWFEYVGTGVVYEVTEMDTYLLPRRNETAPDEGDRTEKLEGGEQTPSPEGGGQTPSPESGGQTIPPKRTKLTVKNGYKLYVITGENSRELLHEEFDYQVRSLAADGYQQKSPSGGSTGEHTILANGNSETFVNRYTGKGTGETTVLEIEKTISFPTDYERPETPDFTFEVELDGVAYKNENYTATNTATGDTISGTTNENGQFTMKGGWKAVFENIPTDVDYKVSEVTAQMPEGWWSTGQTEKKGSTHAPLTAVAFNNANVSFMVTKRLEDYSKPDVWFAFRLTDEYGNVLAGKTYYLYNTTGVPVYKDEGNGGNFSGVVLYKNSSSELERIRDTGMSEEISPGIPPVPTVMVDGKEIVTGQTDPEGYFYLKPGQAALFVGMQPGTSYRVSEEKDPAYTQVLPLPENNGIYTVGSNGQITAVDFVNRPVSGEGTLSVTKNLILENGEGPLNEEDFHFILYKRLTEKEARDLLRLEETEEISPEIISNALQEKKIVLSEIVRLSVLPEQPGGGTLAGDQAGQGVLNQGGQSMLMQADMGDGYASELSLQNIETRGISIGGLKPIDQGWGYEAGGKKYQVYVPVEGRIYSVPEGLSTPTYTTGPDAGKGLQAGEFTLKANQTAVFEGIDLDGEYMVREIKLMPEYTEMIGYSGLYMPIYEELSVGGIPVDKQMFAQHWMQMQIMDADNMVNSIQIKFTNSYKPQKVDLHLTKTDENNETITGNEAHFMLYMNRGKENSVLPETLPEGTEASRFYYSTEAGELTIPNLKAGTYWLYELKAPSGYRILTDPIEINIVRQRDGSLQVTIDGKAYDQYTTPNGIIGGATVDLKGTEQNPGKNDRINIKVQNVYFYELPNSGGMGIYWYSIGGMLLMMAAALILYRYKMRGEVLKD